MQPNYRLSYSLLNFKILVKHISRNEEGDPLFYFCVRVTNRTYWVAVQRLTGVREILSNCLFFFLLTSGKILPVILNG